MTGLSADDVVTSGTAVDETFKLASVVAFATTVELSVEEATGLVATEVKLTFGAIVEVVVVVVVVVVEEGVGVVDEDFIAVVVVVALVVVDTFAVDGAKVVETGF